MFKTSNLQHKSQLITIKTSNLQHKSQLITTQTDRHEQQKIYADTKNLNTLQQISLHAQLATQFTTYNHTNVERQYPQKSTNKLQKTDVNFTAYYQYTMKR